MRFILQKKGGRDIKVRKVARMDKTIASTSNFLKSKLNNKKAVRNIFLGQ
jgi:hypothetical protein